MMGMLNSLRRFFIPALSPAMFNVATIVCAFALVPLMPDVGLPPIAAIAIGTLARRRSGRCCCSGRCCEREGFRYRPVLDFKDPDLREVLRLMGPGTLGLAAVQINVVREHVSWRPAQPQGAVSWLNVRIPADVPADRPVRRLDRDGGAPGHRAPCDGRRSARDAPRPCRAPCG